MTDGDADVLHVRPPLDGNRWIEWNKIPVDHCVRWNRCLIGSVEQFRDAAVSQAIHGATTHLFQNLLTQTFSRRSVGIGTPDECVARLGYEMMVEILRASRCAQIDAEIRTCTLAEHEHTGWIAAEPLDVHLNPTQCRLNVEQIVVARCWPLLGVLPCEFFEKQGAENAQTVVDGDDDGLLSLRDHVGSIVKVRDALG